eukprot:TRINITY_DN1014_c0_g1_i1.p1 TRINITY_DN1014_c0_g1~~TRINITY_DN1014_c0_g1_i1.p1  ORF type:complete len:460 (-),score=130.32 TRINITY_DN1014_c0_g1_i1:101-1423(-)
MAAGFCSHALLALSLLALGVLGHEAQADIEPTGQQPQELQQPQQKDWQKFVPAEYRKFANRQQKQQDENQQGEGESKAPAEAEKSKESTDSPPAVLIAHPLSLTESSGDYNTNVDDRLMEREASLRAVSEAESKETEGAARAREAVGQLRSTSVEGVMSEVHQDWTTVKDLLAMSQEKGAESWEDTLEKRTQLLEEFVQKPRKNVLDFNASQAVQLVYQVNAASAAVAENTLKQEQRVKDAIQKAKYAAVQKVKSMEFEARSAAHEWKAFGKKTVHAQKAAHMGEGVYERHEDEMSDAAGDVGDKAEYYAERLEDKVRDKYSSVEDEVRDLQVGERSKELQRRARAAVKQLHQMAERLGAGAAYEEAESAAKFKAEEKRWNSYQAPQVLAARPDTNAHAMLDLSNVSVASFALLSLVLLVVLRHRPISQPLEIQTPPLLG